MTKIKITTTQNIDIEYDLATVFDRMVAWMIDFAVIIGYVLIAMTVATAIWRGELSSYGYIALVTPAGLYHLLSEVFLNGKSLGKMAMRIKVVRMDGSPAHAGNYLVRWFMRVVECDPFFFFGSIGIGAITLNPRGQRIGDMMAGTTVIKEERKVAMQDTIFASTEEDYEALFPTVSKLKDRDVNTLQEVLVMYRHDRNIKLLNIAANKVCHVLEIVPPGNMDAERFLRTVIRDYNHLS